METITAAVIALLGVIIGALLSWLLGYFLEIHKAKIQKDHTRFSHYHEKQVAVLAHIFKNVSKVGISLGVIRNHTKSFFEERALATPSELDLRNIYSHIGKYFESAKVTCKETIFYAEENAIYIDDTIEERLNIIFLKHAAVLYASQNILEVRPDTESEALFFHEIDSMLTEVKDARNDIIKHVKALLQK